MFRGTELSSPECIFARPSAKCISFRDPGTDESKSYQMADSRGSSLGCSVAFGRGKGFGRLAYMHRTATKKQAQMSIAIRTGSGPIIHRLLHHYTETHGTFIRPIIMYIFSIIALIKTQAYIEHLFNSSLIKARQLIGSNGSINLRSPWDENRTIYVHVRLIEIRVVQYFTAQLYH